MLAFRSGLAAPSEELHVATCSAAPSVDMSGRVIWVRNVIPRVKRIKYQRDGDFFQRTKSSA